MARTANIMTRVDPKIKEQAEAVLSQLGISMSSAMEIYLRQIALQRKIPFEVKLPIEKPLSLGEMSKEQFDALMEQSLQSYANGDYMSIEEFEKAFNEEFQ